MGKDELSRSPVAGLVVLALLLVAAFVGAFAFRETTPPSCRDRRETLSADVDGDGRRDIVWRAVDGDDLAVGVCTASGVETQTAASGGGEGTFYGMDVEPDGRAEVVQGGTTALAALEEVIVFDGSRLVTVSSTGGSLVLETGDAAGDGSFSDWGCDDVAGDGRREIVHSTLAWRGAEASLRRVAYAIDAAQAQVVSDTTRSHPVPADRENPWADRLTTPCGPPP
ncbi:MAG: hypothetical protein ACR2MO_08165 [Acidimicrobiales bacterium]